VLGRMVFGGFFLYNGINHLVQRKQMAQYVASKNVPAPDAAVTASGIALTLGGASLVLGIKPQLERPPSRDFCWQYRQLCTISGA